MKDEQFEIKVSSVYVLRGSRPIDDLSWIEATTFGADTILQIADNLHADEFDTEMWDVSKWNAVTGKQEEFTEIEYNIFTDYGRQNGYNYRSNLYNITIKRLKGKFEEEMYND